ncbi:MAG TPA: methylmalonyl-CoA mutase family protein, partial [Myxococcales bacterium]|nr:methylmalonyl-CoA mutase family protein [Myxococcales bacterium]
MRRPKDRDGALDRLRAATEQWRKEDVQRAAAKNPLRRAEFHTDSGVPIPDILTPADVGTPSEEEVEKYERDVGLPGRFPYTRGPHPTMYRGRLWTMRQFAGFGSPEDTNQRFKYLLEHGVTGLSTAFDMPALMGYDADHPMSRGEVGKEGVAVSTLKDFEVLYSGIPLDRVTTSMTINASA